MPWDTRKAAGDRILSGDWNDMVDAVKQTVEGVKYQTASYIVYKIGTTYYCKNCKTGAVSSGTSADSLIQSAITAGGRHFYLKKSVTWITTSIPADLIVEGESLEEVVIQPSDPVNQYVTCGGNTLLLNLSIYDKSSYDLPATSFIGGQNGVPRKIHAYYNATDSTQNISHYDRQPWLSYIGKAGIDVPGLGIENKGVGDSVYLGVADNGVGVRCEVNNGASAKTGRAIYALLYGAGYLVHLVSKTGATGKLLRCAPETNIQSIEINPSVDTDDDFIITTGAKTGGRMINLYQGMSAFSGYGLLMNFGAGGGSFAGQFIRCEENGSAKFVVYSTGQGYLKKLLVESLATETGDLVTMQPQANLANALAIATNDFTSGNFINLYSSDQAYSGYGLLMNFGAGTGSFSGQFIRCLKAEAAKFVVYEDGAVYSYDGIATKVKAGAVGDGDFTTVQDGKIAIDSTNGRIYFRYNTGWHYVAQTAGFQIRAEDRSCSLCGAEIGAGEPVVGVTERVLEDGALHGEWVHLRCAISADRGLASAG